MEVTPMKNHTFQPIAERRFTHLSHRISRLLALSLGLLLGGLLLTACGEITGVTGMAYDDVTDEIYLGKASATLEALKDASLFTDTIVVKDKDNALIAEIDVSDHVTCIEGLTFDTDARTFWVWAFDDAAPGTRLAALQGHCSFFEIDLNGTLLTTVPAAPSICDIGGHKPGMLAYDGARGGIWVKPEGATTAELYDLSSWQVIHSVDTGIAGEGIAVSPFDGTLYLVDPQGVYQLDPDCASPPCLPATLGINPVCAGGSEGVVVDPTDQTVYIAADTGVHGHCPEGNSVWHIDPHATHDPYVGYEIEDFQVF